MLFSEQATSVNFTCQQVTIVIIDCL